MRPSAQAAWARTIGDGSSRNACTSTGTAAGFPELPSAIAALRAMPSRLVRRIAEPRKRSRNAASSSINKSGRYGCNPSSGAARGRIFSFHGHTS